MGVIMEVIISASIKSLNFTFGMGLIKTFPSVRANDNLADEYKTGKGMMQSTVKNMKQHKEKVA
jgi:hypothetical protein